MINSTDKAENFLENSLPQAAIDKAVKALISLASSATEADKVIRDFMPELDGTDTIPLLEKNTIILANYLM